MTASPVTSPAKDWSKDWTVLEVLKWTTARFTERKLASPRLDAEVLIAHVLGGTRIDVYTRADKLLTADELAALRALIKRRQAGESVAYLVGRKEFWGRDFFVDARVLVPRPDTETLIDEALALLDTRTNEDLRIADVGTGSGAIAVVLAGARPGATVVATDIARESLDVARANAERLRVTIDFVEGDLTAAFGDRAPFDLVAANLPYIPTDTIATLAPEVLAEPRRALDGGADGLDLVRRLVRDIDPWLRPGGALALEIGAGQATATRALMDAAGFVDVRVRVDLGGVERVVSGRKAGAS